MNNRSGLTYDGERGRLPSMKSECVIAMERSYDRAVIMQNMRLTDWSQAGVSERTGLIIVSEDGKGTSTTCPGWFFTKVFGLDLIDASLVRSSDESDAFEDDGTTDPVCVSAGVVMDEKFRNGAETNSAKYRER